jgi:hypothetical protein
MYEVVKGELHEEAIVDVVDGSKIGTKTCLAEIRMN